MAPLRRSPGPWTACCLGVAVFLLASCGGGSGTATRRTTTPAATTGSPAPSATATSGPAQWIQGFCGTTQQNAELYIANLKAAVAAMGAGETSRERESDKQTLYSTVSSGLDAPMTDSADQLAATSTSGAANSAARTFLLGVYQRLHQALAAAETRIQALPTTNASTFVSAYSDAASAALSAVDDAKKAITTDRTLGPLYTATPACR